VGDSSDKDSQKRTMGYCWLWGIKKLACGLYSKKLSIRVYKRQSVSDHVDGSGVNTLLIPTELNFWQMSVSQLLQGLNSPAPSSDDMKRADEIQKHIKHLGHCLASNDHDARIAEFNAELNAELMYLKAKIPNDESFAIISSYAQVAREKNESLRIAFHKGFFVINELDKLLCLISRTSKRSKKISEWLILQAEHISSEPNPEKLFNKVSRVFLKFCNTFTKAHNSISGLTNLYWDYLPKELQEIVESQARRLFLNKETLKTDYSELDITSLAEWQLSFVERMLSGSSELDKAKVAFIECVFKAVEASRSKPKISVSAILHSSSAKAIKNEENCSQSCSDEDEFGYTQEDRVWLNTGISDLDDYGSYEFEPGELESYKPVQYIPGRGFVIFDAE
jgi:hypothetical protein